jgi:hypothetical protein
VRSDDFTLIIRFIRVCSVVLFIFSAASCNLMLGWRDLLFQMFVGALITVVFLYVSILTLFYE